MVATTVLANVRSSARQQELDRRIIPGISTDVQLAYLVLLVVGLLGVPASRTWWQRLWPPEQEAEYAGRAGYWAACAVRFLGYALVFLPGTAVLAAPYSLAGQVRDAAAAPARVWRWLTRRGARPHAVVSGPAMASDDSHPLGALSTGDREWPVLEPPPLRRRVPNR